MLMRRELKARRSQWVLLLGFLVLTTLCRAEGKCPWLNEATAAGVVTGPVKLEMHPAEDGGSICIFRTQRASAVYTLRILVVEMKDPSKGISFYQSRCTSPAISLRAIGNEAVLCAEDAGSFHGEQVIGRVRDNIFIVDVSDSVAKDPSMTRELLQEKTRSTAEQVAGNLF
jgi:hypothetical protein